MVLNLNAIKHIQVLFTYENFYFSYKEFNVNNQTLIVNMKANKSLSAKLYAYPYDNLIGNELRNNVSKYGPKHKCMSPCELGIGDLTALEYLEDKGERDLGELDKDFFFKS